MHLRSLSPDPLVVALVSAELGEPYDLRRTPPEQWRDLFAAIPELRQTVPFAVFRLLGRLLTDDRWEVRAGVAQALPLFADLYRSRLEELLLPLACDPSRRVRAAAAQALAAILRRDKDPEALILRWQVQHPDRARDVLEHAQRIARGSALR